MSQLNRPALPAYHTHHFGRLVAKRAKMLREYQLEEIAKMRAMIGELSRNLDLYEEQLNHPIANPYAAGAVNFGGTFEVKLKVMLEPAKWMARFARALFEYDLDGKYTGENYVPLKKAA